MSKEKTIAIHALGYVGLTAAIHWAKAGWKVIGYDPDTSVVQALREGKPKANEFLGYLGDAVRELVHAQVTLADGEKVLIQEPGYTGGYIIPTSVFEDTLVAPVHSLAVPSERDGAPYDGIVVPLIERLLKESLPGATILVESTLTPGTMDRILENDETGHPKPGILGGHFVAVCPRRDWFADASKNLENLERIVGGVTPHCTDRAVELLSIVSKKIHKTDYRTAELTKALENAWLHALVMLPTEMAMNRPDLNVAQATALASTHWRLPTIFLGPGCGGRCVPLGTRYLLEASGPGGVLDAVDKTERHIRLECARAVAQRKVRTCLVLGMAYRPNFRDMGNSPGLDIARYLRRDFGIEVTVYDPMWSSEELANLTGFPVAHMHADYDAIVLVTPHAGMFEKMRELITYPNGVKFILDTQATWLEYKAKLSKEDCEYTYVGAPGWLKK